LCTYWNGAFKPALLDRPTNDSFGVIKRIDLDDTHLGDQRDVKWLLDSPPDLGFLLQSQLGEADRQQFDIADPAGIRGTPERPSQGISEHSSRVLQCCKDEPSIFSTSSACNAQGVSMYRKITGIGARFATQRSLSSWVLGALFLIVTSSAMS
jgi:hypothetical protein